ncbi:MAG: AAA family ATPase, partial [Limnobacter sp.]|nr:AAA family ATPase [Limnobacter sp.]
GMIRTTDHTGRNVFGLSGIKIGSGASRTTRDLAESLREIGKRVLVVDANAYRQTAQRLFKNEANGYPTLSELLTQKTVDLSFLTPEGGQIACGQQPLERNLPNIEKLGDLLNEFAQRYDFVLVDAPPLLLSADSELVARATQSLIVLAEAENTVRKELLQARRILERINPSSVGAVLNRVSPENGFGGLNAQLQEFVTGQKQTGPSLKEQVKAATKAITWELAAAYLWVRFNVIPLFAVPEHHDRDDVTV